MKYFLILLLFISVPILTGCRVQDKYWWEVIDGGYTSRMKVPSGWLVEHRYGVTFVPDPEHKWQLQCR